MKIFLFLGVWATLLSCTHSEQNTKPPEVPENKDSVIARIKPDSVQILELNEEILRLLKAGDIAGLKTHVHPEKGVLFSPYSFIDLKTDVVLYFDELERLYANDSLIRWGAYDGSGEEMRLTVKDYIKQFVYDLDFLDADSKSFQKIIQTGNTRVNINEIFQSGFFVDNYISQVDPKFEGMDWRALRLVFEKYQNRWYLVAFAHGAWTI